MQRLKCVMLVGDIKGTRDLLKVFHPSINGLSERYENFWAVEGIFQLLYYNMENVAKRNKIQNNLLKRSSHNFVAIKTACWPTSK